MERENRKFNETLKNLQYSWKFIRCYKKMFLCCIFLSILMCGVGIISPLVSAKVLLNLTNGIYNLAIKYSIVMLLLRLVMSVLNYFESRVYQIYIKSATSEIQSAVAEEVLKLETSELDKNSSGIFIERLNRDASDIVYLFDSISNSLISMISNFGILIAFFVISKAMFIYMIVVCVFIVLLERSRLKEEFKIEKEKRRFSERNTGLIGELIRGIRDIKVLNIESNFMTKVRMRIREVNEESYKRRQVNRRYSFISTNVRELSTVLFIVLGTYLVSINRLTAANLLILYMYREDITSLSFQLTYFAQKIKDFNMSAGRIFEIVEGTLFKKEVFGNIEVSNVNGDFEFKDVCFGYNGGKEVLKNINFKVHANETVAFVGKSGVGKTTIFSLLYKLYPVTSGEILIDGININELTKDSIRDNISIITQNPYIFNFTIRENLQLVKPNMNEREMINACKMACIHDFIMSLPDGYDTILGEGGINLSGGQRQRIAIARALLKKTEIILFDEATSALDNETQENIQQAIRNMKGEYTILIIAHRLSTVIDSDRILFIDDGKVVDEGTHQELLKRNLEYRHLYQKELI